MKATLFKRLLLNTIAALALAALAGAWFSQSTGQGAGSITIELPPAHSIANAGFDFSRSAATPQQSPGKQQARQNDPARVPGGSILRH